MFWGDGVSRFVGALHVGAIGSLDDKNQRKSIQETDNAVFLTFSLGPYILDSGKASLQFFKCNFDSRISNIKHGCCLLHSNFYFQLRK
jgi:hypothetical protein